MLNGTGGKSLRVSRAEGPLELRQQKLGLCTIKNGSQVFHFPDLIKYRDPLAKRMLDFFSELFQDLRMLREQVHDGSDKTRGLK